MKDDAAKNFRRAYGAETVISPPCFPQHIPRLTIWHTLQSMTWWRRRTHPLVSRSHFRASPRRVSRFQIKSTSAFVLSPTHSEIDHLAHFAKYDLMAKANSPAGQPT